MKNLTAEQAYRSMFRFLEDYYERTGSDEIASLLSDMQLLADGGTADPGTWEDWLRAVQNALSEPVRAASDRTGR